MKKKKKLKKKELAVRIGRLVDQFADLNKRLNRVSHDRLNQGIQLDQLSEDSGGLQRRLEELREQVEDVVSQEEELRLLMQSLQLESAEAAAGSESNEVEQRIQQELSRLDQQLTSIQDQQQGLEQGLERGRQSVDHVDNKADDLRRDMVDLLSHIRRLEESGSELLVSDSLHESQIRSLQNDIADLSRRIEPGSGNSELPQQEVSRLLQESTQPLHQQLEHLGQKLSQKGGQQKELERRLQELSKRIGETGARVESQHQDETRFNEVLELRLSKLENLAKDLQPVSDADENQLGELEQKLNRIEEDLGSLLAEKRSAAENYLLLDEKSRELAARLDALDAMLSEQAGKHGALDDLISRLSSELENQNSSLDERLKAADLKLSSYLDQQAERPDPMATISVLLEEQRDDFINSMELLKQEIRGLDSKLESLDMDEHESSERLNSLATDLDQQAGSREEMQQALSSARDELSRKVDELNSRLGVTEERLNALGETAKDQSHQLSTFTEEMAEQGKYGVDLKLITASLQDETDSLKARNDELESRIDDLQQTLQRGDEQASQDKQQLAAIEQAQNEFREQHELGMDSLLERMKSTQAKLAEQSGLHEGISQRLDDLESSLQEQFHNIDAQHRKLIENESESRERLNHQAQSNHSLSEAIAEVKIEHQTLLEQTGEQKTFLEAMTSEYGKRQHEAEEMSRRFGLLNGQVESVRTTGNYHTFAIGGLLLLLLFFALLGYNYLSNKIGTVERDISLEMMRISENFVSREESSQSIGASAYDNLAVEELIKNQQRLDQQLVELEQQLAASMDTGDTTATPGTAEDQEPTAEPQTTMPSSGDESDIQLSSAAQSLKDEPKQSDEPKQLDEPKQVDEPSKPPLTERALKPADAWTAMRERGGYTIQLIGVSKRKAIDAFIKRYGLEGEMAYSQTERKGRDWYTLLYGTYERQGEAVKALQKLPEALKSQQPWIRRLPNAGAINPL
ncbi:MAG: SPOR domain-containing protein [Candidatus Thiodiazotropha sp.]